MRVFFVFLLLCLGCVAPVRAFAEAEPFEPYLDLLLGRGWPDFYPPPMSFYVCPKSTTGEFLLEDSGRFHCRHSPIPDDPLPLVAYIVQDEPEERGAGEGGTFPLYLGYMVLAEKEEGMRYSWSGKSPVGYFPRYLFSDCDTPLRDECWYYFKGGPEHCEFAKMNTPASFFLWMKAIGVFWPHYRVLFTAGVPPDDQWVPEFMVTVSSFASRPPNEGAWDRAKNRPDLKNPLPGMRSLPLYVPEYTWGEGGLWYPERTMPPPRFTYRETPEDVLGGRVPLHKRQCQCILSNWNVPVPQKLAGERALSCPGGNGPPPGLPSLSLLAPKDAGGKQEERYPAKPEYPPRFAYEESLEEFLDGALAWHGRPCRCIFLNWEIKEPQGSARETVSNCPDLNKLLSGLPSLSLFASKDAGGQQEERYPAKPEHPPRFAYRKIPEDILSGGVTLYGRLCQCIFPNGDAGEWFEK